LWEGEVQLHVFLASALEGGEWSASRPRRCTPRRRNPVPIWQEAGQAQSWSGRDG